MSSLPSANSNGYSKTDGFPTHTSDEQWHLESALRSFAPPQNSDSSVADKQLERNAHINFLVRILLQGLPSRAVTQDASQPWIIFWVLQSLCILGVGLDPDNKQK